MNEMKIYPIGKIENKEGHICVRLDPKWCIHWPKSYEESGDFDWEAEFNFQGEEVWR